MSAHPKNTKGPGSDPISGLDQLRRQIDDLDVRLVDLLNARVRLALEIGSLKKAGGGEVYVPSREKEVLDKVKALNAGPLPPGALEAVYREIMSASLALESAVKVAYLGPPATFSHQAARRRFGASVEYIDCPAIADVFNAVENRVADYGVVPIENSTEGAVTHTLDRFIESPLKICAEIYLPVSQHLLAKCAMDEVRKVYSHPNVFGQCRRWLYQNLPKAETIPVSSTARAAEMAVAEAGGAALAGDLVAEMYPLNVLARNVQDYSGNATRFLVIGKTPAARTGQDKTSIVFAVKHKVGALHEALDSFKEHELNLTKIESRPSKAKVWEYVFFVDFEGHSADESVKAALTAMSSHCNFLTVLGSYPRAGEDGQEKGRHG